MRSLKTILLFALVIVFLGVQPIMAGTIGGQNEILVASESGGEGVEPPVDVDVSITEESPSNNMLFGFDRTLVIVVGILVVVLLIGLIARGGRRDY